MTKSRSELTERELHVLKLLSDGLNSKEIAKELFISSNTVEYHRKQLLRKTESNNVAHLVAKAFRNGWLTIDKER